MDTTEWLHFHFSLSCIGEGNGNPWQCFCLENSGMREPGGLPPMGSHRVRHDWSVLAVAAAEGRRSILFHYKQIPKIMPLWITALLPFFFMTHVKLSRKSIFDKKEYKSHSIFFFFFLPSNQYVLRVALMLNFPQDLGRKLELCYLILRERIIQ